MPLSHDWHASDLLRLVTQPWSALCMRAASNDLVGS